MNVLQVSYDIIYDFEERKDLHNIPSAIADLDVYSYQYRRNVEDTMQSLKVTESQYWLPEKVF